MRNYISEDDIEQAILKKLDSEPFCYNIIRCNPSPNAQQNLPDGTGRTSKKQCVLPEILEKSLCKINPTINPEQIKAIARELSLDYTNSDLQKTNYEMYQKIRNGIQIETKKKGKQDFDRIKLIDFTHPENNTFTAVSQMWIQGKMYYRRPDVIIFVNGLPLVFIELKNSIVKVEEAYNDNLQNYLKDIPNLFAFNQICVLSNGLETRLGAYNASYDFFFEWLRIEKEDEKVNRKALQNPAKISESSIKYFIEGLLDKKRLVDYIENFILYDRQSSKIIAMNHQFLEVNNLVESVENRKELKGKLGVFWHTQGSGKSYSMVMFTRKVKRKLIGNFTFVIITDREDLDTQIHKHFIRTGVIGQKEQCQPKNSSELRKFLQSNNSFVFTLIQKFTYDKTEKYPVLSTRDDIIVLVDEAHRTQYKDLAENMRTGLPNANFIAFTGTPLLGSKRLTNKWFGNYVSEYNFAQSVEDGATVPLFYSRRVPEVGLKNDFLDDDIYRVLEEEDLNNEEVRLVEKSTERILEVIKRDDRLDKVAQDIAHHFPRRGFLGKGMVVSVDKYTAVKMYDKVKHYLEIEKKILIHERNEAPTKEKRDEITRSIDYIQNMDMAVIISQSADEEEKFAKLGLDIKSHRIKMEKISPEGFDIEDRFKDPNDNLQLVFVCAMWLTGFDVKNLSTLYLDKPMKGHTLMQAMARANRLHPGKTCGIVVDYVNIFKFMKKALSDYATGSDGTVLPAKDIDKLIYQIDETINEADLLLKGIGINLDTIITQENTLDRLEELRNAYDTIIDKEENKNKFKVILNTLINRYEAAKPEVYEKEWENNKFAPLLYLHGLFHNVIDDDKLRKARRRIGEILDNSVLAAATLKEKYNYQIKGTEVIDISKMDIEAIRKEMKKAHYKAVEIEEIKSFLENALQKMINKNCTRNRFSERFKAIIDQYNAGGSNNEEYFNKLMELVKDASEETTRAAKEGLTEEELEIFDLLASGKKLTKETEQKVKLAAKNLYEKLSKDKKKVFVIDWYKDEQPYERVKTKVADILDIDLPEPPYDKTAFDSKVNLLVNHFADMSVQGYGWVSTH